MADDPRRVENPISAIFDLAEEVHREAPHMRRLVWAAGAFIAAWLLLDLILIVQNAPHSYPMTAVFILLFALGVWTLFTLRRLKDFLDYYDLRHSAILSIKQDEPVIYAPQGGSAVDRLKAHLAARNPSMASALASKGASPAMLPGHSGATHRFDYHLVSRPGPLWRALGIGYPGYQMFIRHSDSPPTADAAWGMIRDVEDVCARARMPASRAIMLWKRSQDQDLDEAAYDLLMNASITVRHRGKAFASSLELIVENEDGSYEFIPYLADGHRSWARAQ